MSEFGPGGFSGSESVCRVLSSVLIDGVSQMMPEHNEVEKHRGSNNNTCLGVRTVCDQYTADSLSPQGKYFG